ncbi:MAG: choice-of-anchor L domain-containing protein [Flavobacteriales bacterium]|nr:choice-of-anchor L domain-containing protein [Flavobacteriales bacterium]
MMTRGHIHAFLLAGLCTGLVLSTTRVEAQLTVNAQTDLQQLAEAISGPGVRISNPTINCHSEGYGEFSYTGTLLGLESGVLLSSGRIAEAIGPNSVENKTFQQGTSGSSLLNTVTGRTTYDACRFEFDVIPSGDSLSFQFVFGSEEYNEWVGSQYNDVFGFFISGPGISGDPGIGSDHNIALIPGTNTAVAINNVNSGQNSNHYQYNAGGQQLQMDGYTQNLVARTNVEPCQPYHLKLIVADASDRKFDSWVFVERIHSPHLSLSSRTASGGGDMVEGCNSGFIRFTREPVLPTPLTVEYYLQGTATNGTDYAAIGDVDPTVVKTITIPAGEAFAEQPVNPIADGAAEPTEYIRVILGNPYCTGAILDSLQFNIVDTLIADVSPGNTTICQGGSVQFNTTGGASYAWSPATGLSCTDCPNPIATPATTTIYSVVITEGSCSRTINRQVRVSNPTITSVITKPLCTGNSNGAANITLSGGFGPYTYAWTGPNGFSASTEDLVNVPSGNYTVIATDAYGCSRTASYDIGSPAALQLSLMPSVLPFGQNIACFGGSTGTLDLTITGGAGPFTTQWTGPNGFTSFAEDITGLSAGSYNVSVSDANGCSATGSFSLNQSTALQPAIGNVQGVLCYGGLTGSAIASITGGMPPYAYSWNSSPSQNTATASNLGAGNYTVTVTDGYGCTASADATISGPASALGSSLISQTDPPCYNGSSGSATVSASGGTAPYTFSWDTSPVQTSAQATGLTAGTWSCTITDANGCTTDRSVTINAPQDPISAIFENVQHVTCFGDADGMATIDVSGGSGSFTITWNTTPPQSGPTATGLVPGNYQAQVSDNNGCLESKFFPVEIIGATSPLIVDLVVTPITCFGASNGSINLTMSGGMAPYTHRWYDAANNMTSVEDLNGVDPDSYTLHAYDLLGCTFDTTIYMVDPPQLIASSMITPALCDGSPTGAIDLTASGGTGALAYAWTGPNGYTSNVEDPTAIPAGTYHVIVTDGNGCTIASDHVVDQPGSMVLSSTTSLYNGGWGTSCPSASDGSIDLSINGGSGGYSVSWTGPASFSSVDEDPAGLIAGQYTAVVTDLNGCTATHSLTLTGPDVLSTAINPTLFSGFGVTCTGASDGAIAATITGGTAPYSTLWSGPNGFSSTDEDPTSLAPGSYTLNVTDANGCIASGDALLSEPTPLGSSMQALAYGGVNISCAGQTDGAIDLSITGGATPYSIAWTDGLGFNSSMEDITALAAGTYQATITDANGCISTSNTTLVAPTAIDLSAQLSSVNGNNVSCTLASDGSIDLAISGGTGPYNTNWSNGSTDEDLIGIGAGPYTVNITDANGCVLSASYTLTAPAPIDLQLTASGQSGGTNVSCNGASDGVIEPFISGGSTPYTIDWAGPNGWASTNDTITDLVAGSYTITVTDLNNCSASASVELIQPDPIDIVISTTTFNGNYNLPCAGTSIGTASAAATGGTPGFSFEWSGPNAYTSTNPAITGLISGDYAVVGTDANGCVGSASITLTGPEVIQITVDIADLGGYPVSCNGNDGSASVNIQGGTPQYAINWSGPDGFSSTSASVSGLGAGDYSVTVTDANVCTEIHTFTLTSPDPINASFDATPNGCANDVNGAIDLTLDGGAAPYAITWSGPGGYTSSTEDIAGLPTGSYTLTVTDALGCVGTFASEVPGPAPINSGSYVSFFGLYNLQCQGDNSGVLELTPVGGTTPFSVVINGPDGFSSNSLSNNSLAAGEYVVTITDQSGCMLDTLITLTEPSSGIDATLDISIHPSGTNISCFGASDGWIDATISGGSGPYTFDWRGPDSLAFNTEDITGLPAGTYDYELVVIDANQCAFSTTVVLTQPDSALTGQIQITDYNGYGTSCPGTNDGALELTVLGGSGGNSIQWSGPSGFASNEPLINGLAAGTYTATITDVNGCTAIQDAIVTVPPAIAAQLTAFAFPSGTNISCASASDGSITSNISGGAGALDLAWSGPNGAMGNAASISDLAEGTYCLSTVDANGCSAQSCITLIAPLELQASVNTTNADCGNIAGTADLSVNGGSVPYSFSWSNGSTSEDLSALASGTYSVIITDMNGCTTTADGDVIATPGLVAQGVVTHVLCNGSGEGAIDVEVMTGAAPYSFEWNNAATTEDLNGINAGAYNVLVTDANGCTWNGQWTVGESPAIEVDSLISMYASGHNISTHSGSDGSISVSPFGGSGSFQYQWSNGGTSANISSLSAGSYTVTITDSNGCAITRTFTLTEPDDLDMPTGYTPNGDGYNDAFVVHGLDAYPSNILTVMNRWGNVVYDRLNYTNDWRGENTQGDPLPNGTYFVILTINKGERVLQSYVDLRR